MSGRAPFAAVVLVALAGCDDGGLSRPALTEEITGGMPAGGDPAVVALIARPLECGGAVDVYCTGALIAPRAVVTAAHCVDLAPPGALEVAFGADATDLAGGQRVEVVARVPHPRFDGLGHDIALLELAEAVSVAPAQIIDVALDEAAVGMTARIVGFGIDDDGVSGHKREGTATVAEVRDDVFVLVPGPANTCGGDSGGPVFLDIGGTEVIAGITSFGDPACAASATNTRVDQQRSDFLDAALAAVEAAPAPGRRAPLSPGQSLCDTACERDLDCPARSACVEGACGLAGLAPGRFDGACTSTAECGDGVCAAGIAGTCECYRPCEDCDGCRVVVGGRADSNRPAGVLGLLLLSVAIARRRARRQQARCRLARDRCDLPSMSSDRGG